MCASIIQVEDDQALASLVHEYLQKHGYCVQTITDGERATRQILVAQPDLVILDLMLPGKSGMDICREVRSGYSGPIMMLTALDDDIEQMLGLELGADDYVIKPVQPRLLLSRIRALLRRSSRDDVAGSYIRVGALEINLADLHVSLDSQPVNLTTSEFDLLVLLAQAAGKVVDRDAILRSLRGFEYDGLDRSIDRRVCRLRSKLRVISSHVLIKTVRGKGYQLCAPGH